MCIARAAGSRSNAPLLDSESHILRMSDFKGDGGSDGFASALDASDVLGASDEQPKARQAASHALVANDR